MDFVIGPFGSTVTVNQYVEKSDYRYIRNKDNNGLVISDDDPTYIPGNLYKSLPQFHVKENDLLITVVGTLGKVAIARQKDTKSIFSCKSTILRSRKLDPFYLLVYLNSNIGQLFSLRGVRGAIQQGLNLSDLKKIQVFIASDNFQKLIHHVIELCLKLLDDSQNLYRQAEQRLLAELNLLDWQPQHRLSFVRSYAEVGAAERYDAEYYHPEKYHFLQQLSQLPGRPVEYYFRSVTDLVDPTFGSLIFKGELRNSQPG